MTAKSSELGVIFQMWNLAWR